MALPYTGRCFCEAVRYRVTEAPLTLYACHCTDCQKRSGSAFGLSLWVNRTAIEVTQGDAALQISSGRPAAARPGVHPVRYAPVVGAGEPASARRRAAWNAGRHLLAAPGCARLDEERAALVRVSGGRRAVRNAAR